MGGIMLQCGTGRLTCGRSPAAIAAPVRTKDQRCRVCTSRAIRRAVAPRGIQSFTGPVLRSLFRSPRRHTAADHKCDHDGKKDSKFHHAHSPSPCMGWHQVLRSNAGSLAALTATSLAALRVYSFVATFYPGQAEQLNSHSVRFKQFEPMLIFGLRIILAGPHLRAADGN